MISPQSSVEGDSSIATLNSLLRDSDTVFIKRLALNDWQWANRPAGEKKGSKQNGPYIPVEQRDSGFFPNLVEAIGPKGGRVRESQLDIQWVQSGEKRTARLVNYPSKGEETHLTGIPKGPLYGIPPTSILIIGRRGALGPSAIYTAMVIHAETQAAEWIRSFFELAPGYHSLIENPSAAFLRIEEQAHDFIGLAYRAFVESRFDEFVEKHAAIPDTQGMANWAQSVYLKRHHRQNLNPFELKAPGDTLMTLSQDIEWRRFQELERNARSVEIIRTLFSDTGKPSVESLFRAVIRKFPEINRILLSSAQQRKSRAGYSLEHHLRRMLIDGGIPHESQVVLKEKNRRPDFILPSVKVFSDLERDKSAALILSVKSSLRERWKQVQGESANCELYLATFDGSVGKDAIKAMGNLGVRLVVPESLKESTETEYESSSEVISFAQFFKDELQTRRFPAWKRLGILSA